MDPVQKKACARDARVHSGNIAETGCAVCSDEHACGCCGGNSGHVRGSGNGSVRRILIRFAVSAVIFCAGLGVQIFSASSAVPAFATYAAVLLFIASWAVAGYQVVLSAVKNLFRGKIFDENFLMTIATVGAFIIGQYPEGAAVMLFFNLGELFQEYAVARSRRSITDLVDIRPDTARVLRGGAEVEIDPAGVQVGETIVVRPGEKIPLDGVVTEGASSFDTASLTGESVPRDALPGSEALSGFVNGSGMIRIRVEKNASDSTATKILELIENASSRKAPTEKFITSFARRYTPVVVFAALALAIIPPVFSVLTGGSADFGTWVYRALVFLVISCPCALVISVPLGFFGGIGGAAKRGILIKGAGYLESLKSVTAVVFDKTGTLTEGSFSVKSVEPASAFATGDVLRYAAAAESRAAHPAARAVCEAAREQFGDFMSADVFAPSPLFEERPGYGIRAGVGGKTVLAGSARLLEQERVPVSGSALPGVSGTVVYVAVDGVFAGRIILGDTLKKETPEAIHLLKSLGVSRTIMLSGDGAAAAREAAAAAGIDTVYGELLPQQKVEKFEEIVQGERRNDPKARVAFVGDGVNDAPVLALSDIGIAMGGLGSDAAVEAADVVLMNDDPRSVAESVAVSRRTMTIVRQNIVISFAIKLLFLVLGAFGVATLWEAVFADVGVALLATANAMRVLRIQPFFGDGKTAGNRTDG